MATHDQQMADGDQPVQPGPVLPVDTPVDPPVTPVVQPAATAETRSDYPSQLGSAAAVDSSTQPAVAPRVGAGTGPRPTAETAKRRGASEHGVAGGTRERTRSLGEKRAAAAADLAAGVANHVAFLQRQVAALTARLTKLENDQQAGHDSMSTFAQMMLKERESGRSLHEVRDAKWGAHGHH